MQLLTLRSKEYPQDESKSQFGETDFEKSSDEEAMRMEHNRLATQYKAERELLQQALRESANSSSSASPEPEKRTIEEVVSVEPVQLTDSKKFGALQPIPRREKNPEKEEEEEEEMRDKVKIEGPGLSQHGAAASGPIEVIVA